MIDINNNSFLLSGKHFSYIMTVTHTGFLQHVYYGGKVQPLDMAYYTQVAADTAPICDSNMDEKFDFMMSEYGFFARGDFREPSVIIERGDGSAMSRFRFVSYEVHDGIPPIDNMPHVRRGGKTLIIKLVLL